MTAVLDPETVERIERLEANCERLEASAERAYRTALALAEALKRRQVKLGPYSSSTKQGLES